MGLITIQALDFILVGLTKFFFENSKATLKYKESVVFLIVIDGHIAVTFWKRGKDLNISIYSKYAGETQMIFTSLRINNLTFLKKTKKG